MFVPAACFKEKGNPHQADGGIFCLKRSGQFNIFFKSLQSVNYIFLEQMIFNVLRTSFAASPAVASHDMLQKMLRLRRHQMKSKSGKENY